MRRLISRIAKRFRPARTSPIILMYHRVSALEIDPWELAVSPEHFSDQIRTLRETRTPLRMSDFISRLQANDLPDNAIAITFDDGYRDNLLVAKPILEREGVPATVFLANGGLGSSTGFWWDELAHLVLRRSQAINGNIDLPDQRVGISLKRIDHDDGHDTRWTASRRPRSARQKTYMSLWRTLRALDCQTRWKAMASLRLALEESPPQETDSTLCESQVSLLTAGGLIDIGAHTINHPMLSKLNFDEQTREIAGSVAFCRDMGQRQIGFTYPFGDLNDSAKRAVRNSGALWACSTRNNAVNKKNFDVFDLPRVAALNWSGDQLISILNSRGSTA
jgi:peptidoglycan/xylan/chitin deacetylase (PgdA/CDA1 family)